MTVTLTGYGRYVPDETITGAEIAEASGIPEEVVVEKMGVREKHVCPPDGVLASDASGGSSERSSDGDHVTDMAVNAGEDALADAGRDPADLDVVLYHGSEFKDYVVWSAAANVADRLGAETAFATESYALCAGAPVAIRQAAAMLRTGDVETALLVAASREEDLVDYTNEDSSFMFNFGSGAAAMVLERGGGDRARALVHESAAVTDGSFSDDVVMPAGGSRRPPSAETVRQDLHSLGVSDPDGMKERLADVTLPNFVSVADDALGKSGLARDDLGFVAVTHMKRSFHDVLLSELGVDPDRDGYYLDDYGHVQSADQVLALDEGLQRGRVEPGDVVLFLAAGTGYTWAATALTWLG
jgi:3-oxoacyl-[acyl-carrier-protein] synthase-3